MSIVIRGFQIPFCDESDQCQRMRAALHAPRLFSSVILVDPVIYPAYAFRIERVGPLLKGALSRRDHWPNR